MKEKEEAEENKSKKIEKKVRNTEWNLIHIEEDFDTRCHNTYQKKYDISIAILLYKIKLPCNIYESIMKILY